MFYTIALNLGGLIGLAVGVAAGYGAWLVQGHVRPELEGEWVLAYCILTGAFGGSLFAMVWDRCELRGLFTAYAENVRQTYCLAFLYQSLDIPPNADPARRLAVLATPVVVWPVLVVALGAGFWIAAAALSRAPVDHEEYGMFVGIGTGVLVVWWAAAWVTRGVRLIEPSDPEVVDLWRQRLLRSQSPQQGPFG